MIRLLMKFMVSKILDEGRPLPPFVQRRIQRSGDLRRFAQDAETLGRLLKSTPAYAESPAWLHQSVMTAVGRSEMKATSPRRSFRPLLLAASVAALMALFGVLGVVRVNHEQHSAAKPTDVSSLSLASSALEQGGSLMRQAPQEALAPLSDEMERLRSDLARAQEFLLASLP